MSAFNHPKLLKQERLRRESNTCTNCGYDLIGIPLTAPCPECGTPRPVRPARTPAGESQGLMRAHPVELWRYGTGFAGLTAAASALPIILISRVWLPGVTLGAQLAIAGLWWASLALLLLRPFRSGPGPAVTSPSLHPALTAAVLATQAFWAVLAVVGHSLAIDWLWWGLLGVAGLGLFPTMWAAGELLEWGGDESTGRRTKWMLLTPIWVGLFAGALAWVLSLLIPRIPGVLTLMVKGTIGLSVLVAYGLLIWRLGLGVSMARWAATIRHNLEGRDDRINAHRAHMNAQQAELVAEHERQHARPDRPVGLDDFGS